MNLPRSCRWLSLTMPSSLPFALKYKVSKQVERQIRVKKTRKAVHAEHGAKPVRIERHQLIKRYGKRRPQTESENR